MGHHIVLNSQNCGGIPMALVTFLLDPYKNKIYRPHIMDLYPHVCWFVPATSREIINCSWTPCRYSRLGKVAEGQKGTRKGTLRGRPKGLFERGYPQFQRIFMTIFGAQVF